MNGSDGMDEMRFDGRVAVVTTIPRSDRAMTFVSSEMNSIYYE